MPTPHPCLTASVPEASYIEPTHHLRPTNKSRASPHAIGAVPISCCVSSVRDSTVPAFFACAVIPVQTSPPKFNPFAVAAVAPAATARWLAHRLRQNTQPKTIRPPPSAVTRHMERSQLSVRSGFGFSGYQSEFLSSWLHQSHRDCPIETDAGRTTRPAQRVASGPAPQTSNRRKSMS